MSKSIAQLMTRDVVQVSPQTTLGQCAELMARHRISSLIIGEHDLPVGILTERDVVRLLSQNAPLDQSVSALMTVKLVTVPAETDYRDAYHLFVLHNIRHLVVVEDDGRLAGIVTETDFRRNAGVEEFIGLRTVASIMDQSVLMLAPNSRVIDAAAMMHSRRTSCAVVVEGLKPIGIVTERDMVRLYRHRAGEVLIRDIMSSPVATAEPEHVVVDVVQRMQIEAIRHLVVVNARGETLAVVTEHDVVKHTEGQYVELLNRIIHEQVVELELKQAKIDELMLQSALTESEKRLRHLQASTINDKALLRTLIDHIPDLIFLKNTEGVYLGFNKACEGFFGVEESAVVGKTDFDFVNPETAEFFRQKDREVMVSGQAHINEEWVVYPDGHRECLETLKTPYLSEQGELLGMIGISRNITKRKKADRVLRESEEKLRSLFEMAPLGIARNAMDGRFIEANKALLDMVGYSLDELKQLSYWRLTPDDYGIQETLQLRALEKSGRYGPYEKEYLHRDGRRIPVRLNGVLITGSDGSRYIWSIVEDISERKRAEEEMQLASMVYMNSGEAMLVTDADGLIITTNPAFTELTGYSPEEVLGQTPRILNSGLHDRFFYDAMWQKLNNMGFWQGEIWNKRKNGEIYAEWLTINTIYKDNGSCYRRVALFSDITDKKKAEEMIWMQANFDPLTGLPNRRMFNDRLNQEIKKAHRAGQPLALMFIDLDRFKEINDILGHDMGDLLLREAANRLSSCVRETDTVARLGGDEFTVIVTALDDTGSVERIAQDILRKLSGPFQLDNETLYISASIGITFYPDDATDIEELRKNADQAMYSAKHQGRNRFSYYTPSMRDLARKRMRLANDLRIAMAEEQFRVHYQPIVDLNDGSIRKAEALIRWQHPDRGLISPSEFIGIAEETGRIVEIGDWVFHEATLQVKHWRQHFRADFQVSVNKSPVQFQNDETLYRGWIAQLQNLGLPGDSVVIEITESLLLDSKQIVNDKLLLFRDVGIQVAIDDFGTGYSSLAYLKLYDIDYLKIDQSFVRNLKPDSSDLVVCEAIIAMAHKLGMKVIAEGVETVDQRDLLLAAGCDCGQGFLFSKPLPAKEFDALLSRLSLGPVDCAVE
ncbi:EAL domain-containing protein [Methylomonas sp. LL1]|uniref:EAL domain-containing protein n=1 Tax=Methylomonas sp. LL1 TaxID=2785785 RepID=UPI0018C359CE|nr:EAL domain-containing protein [Methylomonas sp. LL1]QPK63585.1 EAL domain-containing protein [Methylomonas sp. LL1]